MRLKKSQVWENTSFTLSLNSLKLFTLGVLALFFFNIAFSSNILLSLCFAQNLEHDYRGSSYSEKSFSINKTNVESYKNDLIAPIAYWIEKGIFRIRAVNSNPELSDLTLDLVQNVIKAQNNYKVSLFDAEYLWLNSNGLIRKADFALLRKSNPFYEVFRFYEPDSVNLYSTVTQREKNKDAVSHYSPVVKAVRPMLAENRSDEIIEGQISLDDIFVFSANLKNFKVKVLDKKLLLVPFSNSEFAVLSKRNLMFRNEDGHLLKFPEPLQPELPKEDLKEKPEEKELEKKQEDEKVDRKVGKKEGKEKAKEQKGVKSKQVESALPSLNYQPEEYNTFFGGDVVSWNYNEDAFRDHVSWLPLSVTFEKRELLVVELKPKGPYFRHGKQILFIDTVSGVPVYKISYSRSGQYMKTVIGAWRRVLNEKLMPYFVLAVDKSSEYASLLEIKNAQFYDNDKLDFNFLFGSENKEGNDK